MKDGRKSTEIFEEMRNAEALKLERMKRLEEKKKKLSMRSSD